MKNSAQTAIEFIVTVGLALSVFTIFFLAIQENNSDKMQDNKNLLVKLTAQTVQEEINLASGSSDGYSRNFELPEKISNWDYDVVITGNLVYVRTWDGKSAIALPIINVSGNVLKGENTIQKQNGQVYLNLGSSTALAVTSSQINSGGIIPVKYTCDDADISPPLEISNLPGGTISLAIILDDPDAPGVTFLHWIAWNISSDISTIPEDSIPAGIIQGQNDFMLNQYSGPCPPFGESHRYYFRIYALDSGVSLPEGSTRAELEAAMSGHIIEQNTLMGRYY